MIKKINANQDIYLDLTKEINNTYFQQKIWNKKFLKIKKLFIQHFDVFNIDEYYMEENSRKIRYNSYLNMFDYYFNSNHKSINSVKNNIMERFNGLPEHYIIHKITIIVPINCNWAYYLGIYEFCYDILNIKPNNVNLIINNIESEKNKQIEENINIAKNLVIKKIDVKEYRINAINL